MFKLWQMQFETFLHLFFPASIALSLSFPPTSHSISYDMNRVIIGSDMKNKTGSNRVNSQKERGKQQGRDEAIRDIETKQMIQITMITNRCILLMYIFVVLIERFRTSSQYPCFVYPYNFVCICSIQLKSIQVDKLHISERSGKRNND